MSVKNEDLLLMIEQATKAPSGHNTQPWLFKVVDDVIEIHPDFTKALLVVDPNNRELFISLGCATENLCITAKHLGYETSVSVIENPTVIRIHLKPSKELKDTSLFEQINVRQTNRRVYNGRLISDKEIKELKSLVFSDNIAVHFYKKGSYSFDTISEFIYRGNTAQMKNEKFKTELKDWIRYNGRDTRESRNGLSYAVFGAPNLPRFIAKPIVSQSINEKSQNKEDKKKIKSSSHFVLFTTKNNSIEEWIELGRVLEQFLLCLTSKGIIHAYANQPNEEESLSRELALELEIPDEYTAILIRVGYGKSMPYSLREQAKIEFVNA